MIDFEIFSHAFNNIRGQGIRSYLTLLGVVIGIAAIIALVSVGQGMNDAVTDQFEKLGLNTVIVAPGSGSGLLATLSSSGSSLRESDIKKIESIKGVESVMPVYVGGGIATYANEKQAIIIAGIDPDKVDALEDIGMMEIEEGRKLSSNDKYALVVAKKFSEDLFERELKLKSRIEINGKKFRIVGTIKESGMSFGSINMNNIAFAPADTVKEVFGASSPRQIMVKTFGAEDVQPVKEKIESTLKRAHGSEDFHVSTMEQMREKADSILGLIQAVLVGIAAISLIVGGIGIMNTMLMAVMERTREIGVMKAIGATNTTVLLLFLVEAGFIGLIGGLIGIIVGLGSAFFVAYLVSSADMTLNITISIPLIMGALTFSMLVGMISGIYPARRAAHLDPTEAIRSSE